MVALGYGFYFHMDKLPGGLQLWLQQWLSKEHERPATTSKLIAYHLELWFSDNRSLISQMTCQTLHSVPDLCMLTGIWLYRQWWSLQQDDALLYFLCDTNIKAEPAERPSGLLDCCSPALCSSDIAPLS